jgi:hypothetical protein
MTKSTIEAIIRDYISRNEPLEDIGELDDCYADERCAAAREIAKLLGVEIE